MSASLIEALTCGADRSLSVMNALPVLLVDEVLDNGGRAGAGRTTADPLPNGAVETRDGSTRRRHQRGSRQVVLRGLQRGLRASNLCCRSVEVRLSWRRKRLSGIGELRLQRCLALVKIVLRGLQCSALLRNRTLQRAL